MLLWHLIFSFYSLPLFFFTIFLFKYCISTSKTAHKKNLPPSPPKLPIIGHFHKLGLLPHRSLQSLSKKYGPVMLLHFGSVPTLVVSSAVAAREIMKTQDQTFSSRPPSGFPRRLTYLNKDVAFSPYGEYWRQIRSICVLNLLSAKRVQSYRTVREEETVLMIEKISRSCSSSSPLVNLSDLFISVTNGTICRVALGRKYDGEGGGTSRFKKLLSEYVELLGVFNVGDYFPWLAVLNRFNGLDARVDRAAKEMDEFLEEVLEEHIDRNKRESSTESTDSGSTRQDFVDILLQIQRDDASGSHVGRDTIKAIILDMFAAGTDTTFTTIEWTMAELLRHPEIMKKLQKEVREIAKGKENVTEDCVEKMHYLKAVFKETLRLNTTAPLLIPHEAIRDANVKGYDISAGTRVLVNAWAIARDPLSWGEDPEEFRPERFLNNSIDFKGHDFEFIPFGSGRRGCPGMGFAMNVGELALANVVYKFDLSLPGGANGADLDMTGVPGLAIHKKNPLIVVATPHSC